MYSALLRGVPRLICRIILICGTFSTLSAQTIISGRITDAATGAPIAAASVQFRGGKGMLTESGGNYQISTSLMKFAQIQGSYVGYKTRYLEMDTISSV